MTNLRSDSLRAVPRTSPRPSRLALALGLLLALPLVAVQAQGLKASPQLQLPSIPAASSARPLAGGGVTRAADFIVAVVNSEPITNSEVRTKVFRTEQQMQQQGMAMPPRSELVRGVLDRMISDKAQLQLARTSGVKIDDNAVLAAVQAVARQNNITIEELRQRLKNDGIAYSQFESEIRDELLVSRLRQREMESRVTVTERDIDVFMQEQAGTANAAALQLNLGEILIAVPENATPAQVAVFQAKAQKIADRARAGEDFTLLSNEASESPTRLTGGQMGLRSVDRYPPLFVESTAALKAGGVAGPVRSGAGFHVLKVIEKKQGGMPDATVTQTHARHILLRTGANLSEAAAIEKLAGFKRRIQAGQADFAELARQNSDDASAKEGGDLGWANPGLFVPEFEKALSALAPNQISDPLVSRFGVHLIQLLERRETQLTEREQREIARNILREKKQDEAYIAWAQEVRGRAYVEMREPAQ